MYYIQKHISRVLSTTPFIGTTDDSNVNPIATVAAPHCHHTGSIRSHESYCCTHYIYSSSLLSICNCTQYILIFPMHTPQPHFIRLPATGHIYKQMHRYVSKGTSTASNNLSMEKQHFLVGRIRFPSTSHNTLHLYQACRYCPRCGCLFIASKKRV